MSINPANITTVRVDQLPPSTPILSDLMCFEKSDQILYQMSFTDLIAFIALQTSALQFEVKRMSVTQVYIDANFDVTGLGINICAGFAICNGQNGTENLDGRVGIAYGAIQNNIGGFGGEKEHVLTVNEMPIHNHSISSQSNSDTGAGKVAVGGQTGEGTDPITDSSGGGLAHNNMQPYIVQLYIMKL